MKSLAKSNIIRSPFIKCLLLIVLFSCGSYKKDTFEPPFIGEHPKIIFLNYTIKRHTNDSKTIRLIHKIEADGKLKNHKPKNTSNTGDLRCDQIDKNGIVLQSSIIKNPLIKTIEYIDHSKKFKTDRIELDNTSFSLRLQLYPKTKYISITAINSLKENTKPLIKTKINQ